MEKTLQSGITGRYSEVFWRPDGTLVTNETSFLLSGSIICADPLDIGQEIRLLEEGNIDLLHFDVMDGNFVPRLGLTPELLKAIRQLTHLPINVHLMLTDLERYIPLFAGSGADIITIHVEATTHLPRFLKLIHQYDAFAGVALNPSTPIDFMEYVLDAVDFVLLMSINPGCVGESYLPSTVQKLINITRLFGNSKTNKHIIIDGNINSNNAVELLNEGATILVCGSSSIFDQKGNVLDSLSAFRNSLNSTISRLEKV